MVIFPEESIIYESIHLSSFYLPKGHAFSLLSKKTSVTFVRMIRLTLFSTTAVGFYSGFYIRISSEYSINQGSRWGISGWTIMRENIKCNGDFWLNLPNRVLAEDRPGLSDIT